MEELNRYLDELDPWFRGVAETAVEIISLEHERQIKSLEDRVRELEESMGA